MLPHHTKLTKYFFIAFLLLVLAYAYYEAQSFLFGPEIVIDAPDKTIAVHDELVEISGTTENVVDITLSGRPLLLDDTGTFRERLLLAPGMNTFVFEARDRFDRHTREVLYILYEEDESEALTPPSREVATTTEAKASTEI